MILWYISILVISGRMVGYSAVSQRTSQHNNRKVSYCYNSSDMSHIHCSSNRRRISERLHGRILKILFIFILLYCMGYFSEINAIDWFIDWLVITPVSTLRAGTYVAATQIYTLPPKKSNNFSSYHFTIFRPIAAPISLPEICNPPKIPWPSILLQKMSPATCTL